MKKIAVFVEGQSEQIFVRSLLQCALGHQPISFQCIQLAGDHDRQVPYSFLNPAAVAYFLIVNVGSDERVLSAVKERERALFAQGYTGIIALRDMYSQAYDNRAGGQIKDEVTDAFLHAALAAVATMSRAGDISLHFAIMEFEAWLLAMGNLLCRAFPALTPEVVQAELGCRLSDIDRQTHFYRPSRHLDRMLRSVGAEHDKSRKELERICAALTPDDIPSATGHGRCRNLRIFYETVQRCPE
ncbi:MAG: DUF4276 family protein [Planctomycetes bacterium]|nr:DUF4276 family protein [Planctomycetota bacterium]